LLGLLRVISLVVAIALLLCYWDGLRDFFAGCPRGNELLFCAAGSNDLAGVDRALAQGADVNAHSSVDTTPLIYACGNGDDAMVKALLARGADPNIGAQGLLTPLQSAASSGNASSVRILLEAGADPNAMIRDQTVLDLVQPYHRQDVIEALLQHGARHALEICSVNP
jgi:ankyrin repeat protein